MNVYLKIKLKSLAAEATMIRKEERRQNIGTRGRKRIRRLLAGKVRPYKDSNETITRTEAERKRLLWRLKPPTEKAMKAFWGLRHHRIEVVRVEYRATLLAYGFLRGRPYIMLEPNAKTQPNWSKVEDMVRRYGDAPGRMPALELWMLAGKPKEADKVAA